MMGQVIPILALRTLRRAHGLSQLHPAAPATNVRCGGGCEKEETKSSSRMTILCGKPGSSHEPEPTYYLNEPPRGWDV